MKPNTGFPDNHECQHRRTLEKSEETANPEQEAPTLGSKFSIRNILGWSDRGVRTNPHNPPRPGLESEPEVTPAAFCFPPVSEYLTNHHFRPMWTPRLDCRLPGKIAEVTRCSEFLENHAGTYVCQSLHPMLPMATPFQLPVYTSAQIPEGLRSSWKLRKCRRNRTVFTEYQLRELEGIFNRIKYLSPVQRSDLADRLQLSVTQVKTWFQNRRMKWKKNRRRPTNMTT